MQRIQIEERGVTLIELLITIAVLTLVLAGIYGLLNSAYQSYNHSRAKLESQQTARIVLDYLVYRLREVDGGSSTTRPERCTNCHSPNMDQKLENNIFMPCTTDVTIPQKAPMILEFKEVSFAPLAEIPTEFQNMTGNYIKFQADLLPLHGFNESFTDSPSGTTANGRWDWTAGDAASDLDQDETYDRGEPELIEDMNDNNQYDYFGETWTFKLRKSADGPYYELVESLNFTSLEPRITKAKGKLLDDNSVFPAEGYTSMPVAYGITGLWITKVPRVANPSTSTGKDVASACTNSADATACHGSSAGTSSTTGRTLNIYGNATSMSYSQFVATHGWWNIGGLSIEVTTTDTKGRYQQFTKLREFVNFRNLEINQ
jgi:prepilin-type N-terminal cleavage/methylation domain-containing protein